jgi:hypothetical protein
MNRTDTFAARRRSLAAAWLIATWIFGMGMTPGLARAQDATAQPRPAPIETAPPAPAAHFNGPRVITDWQEGEPLPPGYHPVQRTRKGAIVAGAVTLGILYFVSALIAAVYTDSSNHDHTSNPAAGLFVPVVGPFITMTQSSSATADVFLVMDGGAQAAGAILLVYGLTSPQTVLVRDSYFGRPIFPKPMLLGRNGGGLGLVGSF